MAFYGQLTGNLGRDPELKYLDSGKTVANFTIAVRQNKKDAPARWVKVALWGKPAEYVGNYVRKGDKVVCFGRVEPPELFTRRDGSQGLAEVFTADNIEKWNDGGQQQQSQQAPAAAPPAQQQWQPDSSRGTVAASQQDLVSPPDDDGIPF
jgi:single-strand DNA-binding protein